MATSTLQGTKPAKKIQDHHLFHLLAGGLAGAASKTAVAPFDRAKILCQTGECKGVGRSVILVVQREGWLGLWRGNAADVLRIVPNRGVMFMTNDYMKDLLRAPGEKHVPGWKSVLSGAAAGATATLATYPLDLARGRMAGKLGTSRYKTPWSTITLTVQEEGFAALYRGLGPTLAGCLPYEGLKFGIYESLVSRAPQGSDGRVSVWWNLACGAVAGVVAGSITYPNDTVRRRMQMQGMGTDRKYSSAVDCYVKMYRQEGIRPFFGGWTANVWRVGPSAAIQFGAYEALKHLFSFLN